jgi:sigma-B regulation protein RsbU (phosphoserine phosphatase)
VQGRIQTAARHARLAPQELAEIVNADLFTSTQGQRYATMIYGTLDLKGRRIRLVNAGHPAALLFSPGLDEPVAVAATGSALGLMDTAHYSCSDVAMPAGSILVAFTDGVTEALDLHEEEFSAERLAGLVLERRQSTAAALCAAILESVRGHRGARQHQDDVTVLVVRATEAD